MSESLKDRILTVVIVVGVILLALAVPGCTGNVQATNGPAGVECVTWGAPWHRPCPCPEPDGGLP